jgi:hypothetical protein
MRQVHGLERGSPHVEASDDANYRDMATEGGSRHASGDWVTERNDFEITPHARGGDGDLPTVVHQPPMVCVLDGRRKESAGVHHG